MKTYGTGEASDNRSEVAISASSQKRHFINYSHTGGIQDLQGIHERNCSNSLTQSNCESHLLSIDQNDSLTMIPNSDKFCGDGPFRILRQESSVKHQQYDPQNKDHDLQSADFGAYSLNDNSRDNHEMTLSEALDGNLAQDILLHKLSAQFDVRSL